MSDGKSSIFHCLMGESALLYGKTPWMIFGALKHR